ncbi:MAG: hypothetical protein AMJ88_03935 [Anaerolineae bacterium SM23_ 63]|nr:MAG: hypothetical protein AMJ88_03935 [Anaerolineae bacterium SM23_ 63]
MDDHQLEVAYIKLRSPLPNFKKPFSFSHIIEPAPNKLSDVRHQIADVSSQMSENCDQLSARKGILCRPYILQMIAFDL